LAETKQFVDELVHRGVAEPDGTGGIRFLWGHGAGGRVQRATEPAPPANQPSIGSRVWTAVTSTFTDDIEEAIERPWGITLDESAEHSGPKAVTREQNRQQVKEKFQAARLEHLKAKKVQETPGGVLTDADQAALKAEVDKEIESRLEEVKKRTDAQLERVNKHLSDAKQSKPSERLDPDLYDAIYNKLFPSDVAAPIPPPDDATTLDEQAKQIVAKAKAGAGTTPKPGDATPPGGATPPEMPPGGTTPPEGATPLGGATPGGAHTDGPIANWADVKGSYLTDLTSTVTSPFGITLTDAERNELWGSDADKKGATTTPGTVGTPAGATAPHGIEMLDLDRIDLEDLTRRLFQRVRSDLRRELLVDRERSGRLNDMR
jgi:hypothetical protein